MKDYTYLYRSELDPSADWQRSWDLLISAFDGSERVKCVFNKACATAKHWIVHNEYGFPQADIPDGSFVSNANDEAEFILEYADANLKNFDLTKSKICLDITGFMRPHMMFLIKYLVAGGLRKFDVIYSEPKQYTKREHTDFSDRAVTTVRQVIGFEGLNNNDTSNDVLIIGAGYESHLISEVADDKGRAEHVVIFGLPSLRADMYQQNRLRVHDASDSINSTATGRFFAPANDPFVAASVLSEIVSKREVLKPLTNLYLAPLATKAQALGFVIFYLSECQGRCISILYPFSPRYALGATQGISRVWVYSIEI